MRVTFIDHSGFFVELDGVCFLFDWWKGELPPLPDKPLLVFASHRHGDHFDPRIFTLAGNGKTARFILGSDLRVTPRNLAQWGVSDPDLCLHMRKEEEAEVYPGVRVQTLRSTDEGVAFLVRAEGKTVFHAGDLNWWHWEEDDDDDPDWNVRMARDFKRYIEPLRGVHIDLAMFPVDPRLKEPGFWGPAYMMELTDTDRLLPMHQWNDFAFTDAFRAAYPAFADKVVKVERTGQTFDL